MKKWELARYLIDAKKNIDSISYIENNIEALQNINVRKKVNDCLREYYISCCVVLDKSFPKKKKELIFSDEIVKRLYHERDKNSAHKDEDYKPKNYASLAEMVSELQAQLNHVLKLCNDFLPAILTLDFVPHDKELFRMVEGITMEKEEEIKNAKHPLRNIPPRGPYYKFPIFSDTEDLKVIPDDEKTNYAVHFEEGLNRFEGLQNHQDSCIKANVLHDTDTWCSPKPSTDAKFVQLQKLGFIDQFGIPHPEVLCDPIIKNRIDKILQT